MRLSGFCFQISGWSQVWMFGSDWKTSRFWFLSPSQFSWTSCRMFVWTRSGSLLVSEVGPAGCLLGAGFPPLTFTLGFSSSEKQLRQETDCSGRHQIIFLHSRGVFLFLSAVLENTRQLSNVYEAADFGNRTGCGGWWMKIQFILLYFFSHDRRFCWTEETVSYCWSTASEDKDVDVNSVSDDRAELLYTFTLQIIFSTKKTP